MWNLQIACFPLHRISMSCTRFDSSLKALSKIFRLDSIGKQVGPANHEKTAAVPTPAVRLAWICGRTLNPVVLDPKDQLKSVPSPIDRCDFDSKLDSFNQLFSPLTRSCHHSTYVTHQMISFHKSPLNFCVDLSSSYITGRWILAQSVTSQTWPTKSKNIWRIFVTWTWRASRYAEAWLI